MSCLICERIEMIKSETSPHFVRELETGYVVIGDHQHFKGYTLFLCKEHVTELHFLEPTFKMKYLEEMALVAEAVYHAFKPDKLNYELLGNGDSHLHWHLFPRVENDMPIKGPVWWLPREEMWHDDKRPIEAQLKEMIELLAENLELLLSNKESELK